MKKSIFITLIIFTTVKLVIGQNQDKYAEYVKEAEAFYFAKEYKASAQKYKAAFDQLDGKAISTDRYNAACAYAMSDDKENAFYHLFYLAENPKINYRNLNQLTTDSDLTSLHSDTRWKKVLELVKANKEVYEKDLDKELVAVLDTIYQEDQKYRIEAETLEKKYGFDSDEVKAQWSIIREKDAVNLKKVTRILDERGWLGAKVVGHEGNTTLFLVIQHSDIQTQEKYLPMMQEAVKNGNANASSLALLEDRVALGKGEKQIYGSQIGINNRTGEHFVLPLLDPDNVDKRRAEVGLGSLKDYVAHYGIVWDVEEYKKKFPEE